MSQDKAEFFDRLQALKDSPSDAEESDCGNLQASPNRSRNAFSAFCSPSKIKAGKADKPNQRVPTFQRTESAPVSSRCSGSELPHAYAEGAPSDSVSLIGISEAPGSFVVVSSAGQLSERRPEIEHRTVSNPIPGSLALTNSNGIAAMLGKKRPVEATKGNDKKKQKDSTLTLVPEDKRIFTGLTFYYIPPNDIAPIRRRRINKARSYGADWTREWTNTVTHVVADKSFDYGDVITHLKAKLKSDKLHSEVVVINEDYPLDCITYNSLLDSNQAQYVISGMDKVLNKMRLSAAAAPNSDPLNQKTRSKEEPAKIGNEPETAVLVPPTSEVSLCIKVKKSTGHEVTPCQSPSRPLDELDQAIQTAREQGPLPLDNEEEEYASSLLEQQEDFGDSEIEKSSSISQWQSNGKDNKCTFRQENFSCMSEGTGKSSLSNPKSRTIEILQKMADHYERTSDEWRVRAYRKAIGILRKQTIKISTCEEAKRLPNVGERLALKTEEIVVTDRLRRLEYAELEPDDEILQLFLNIYGVGVSQASRWISQGYKTLDDLKANIRLTDNQLTGIVHYDDFNTRIARVEVTALGVIVCRAATLLDPDVRIIIGGSYRRGAVTSGDIDCLVTKRGTTSRGSLVSFLDELIKKLISDGFLVAALAVSRSETGSKWHGACVLPGNEKKIWRRIDFLLVPETELGAALIYFTGDDIFNRSMRLLASYKGLRLNQRGLYRNVIRGPNRVKITQGSLVEGAEEVKIFEALGIPWRPPWQRICH